MEKDKIIDLLKNHISEGNLKPIFELGELYLIRKESKDNLLMLHSRYNTLEQDNMLGMVSDYNTKKNALSKNLLTFIGNLKEEDFTKSIIIKNSNSQEQHDKFLNKLKIHGKKRWLHSSKGDLTCKRETIKFKNTFLEVLHEYTQIAHYDPIINKSKGKLNIKIEQTEISISFCITFFHIGIYQNTWKESILKKSNVFMIDVNEDEEIVWANIIIETEKYTSKKIAEMVLQEVFEDLINPPKIKYPPLKRRKTKRVSKLNN